MLQVVTADAVAANDPFTIVVPGQQVWNVLSVRATISRDNGGTGTRTLVATVTDGTTQVVSSPVVDTAPDPGDLQVTWSAIATVASADADNPFTNVPLPAMVIPAGYTIIGSIVNPQPFDQWTLAVAWVDIVGGI